MEVAYSMLNICLLYTSQLDWTIGEIMHTLDSLHIADNTILVLIAVVDNRTVIAGKDQDGVVCDVEAVQCVQDVYKRQPP